MNQIGIIGAGGHAREIASYIKSSAQVLKFNAADAIYADKGVLSIEVALDSYSDVPVVIAVGSPSLRKELSKKWSGLYGRVISEHAYIDQSASIGLGSQVAPMAAISVNVNVGMHVIVNTGVSIAHDCTIGDFSTVSPGAVISGGVNIGDGVFIGAGATISNGLTIAAGAIIGAGSVVINDIKEENSTHVGNPTRLVRRNDGWMNAI